MNQKLKILDYDSDEKEDFIKDKETKQSVNVLCDVGEAIIGAIYIDSDIEQDIRFMETNWRDMIENAIARKISQLKIAVAGL